jgi:hypothetical protein
MLDVQVIKYMYKMGSSVENMMALSSGQSSCKTLEEVVPYCTCRMITGG